MTKDTLFITNCQMGYFSVARYSGGAVVNGKHFVYDYSNDTLIRKDVFKKYLKMRKEGKSVEEIASTLNPLK